MIVELLCRLKIIFNEFFVVRDESVIQWKRIAVETTGKFVLAVVNDTFAWRRLS